MKKLLFCLAAVICLQLKAAETALTLDREKSRLEYDVRSTFENFTGRVLVYAPEISVDPASGRVLHAQLRFRFADMSSGNDERDLHMRNWQNTDQFPEVVYALTSLEPAAEPETFTARGVLLFHGQSREIVFPVKITRAKTLWTIAGETALDVRDFGLTPLRKFLVARVNPVVKVRFQLTGTAPGN
jgi:polyisoprenoid-binding protein YceI